MHKFIHRIRLLVTAAMGLLTTQQSVFVDINSKIIVRESSVSGETSSDNELKNQSHIKNNLKEIFQSMVKSKSINDKRFLKFHHVRKTYQQGVGIGLNDAGEAKEM